MANSMRNNDDDEYREDMICLGAVFGVSGVHGAVRLKVFTENINAVSDYGQVTVIGHEYPEGKKFKVKILHNVKGGIAIKFKGLNDRNQAEALKGSRLYIERSALPDLKEEGDFYFDDLIGLKAKDQNGDFFGSVDGVFNFGAGDIVEVNLEFEKGTKMYPFTNEVFPEVNLDSGYLMIDRAAFGDKPEEVIEENFNKDQKE
jgi:16S rRNA processing protein RimM